MVNVYLPYDKKDDKEEYLDHLTKLHNLLDECISSCITVVGDYNANVLKCQFGCFIVRIV